MREHCDHKLRGNKKVNKGVRRMPRLSEAKKDVISCEKLWGGAITVNPQISELGQPTWLKAKYSDFIGKQTR